MRFLCVSDIHGHARALEAVLKEANDSRGSLDTAHAYVGRLQANIDATSTTTTTRPRTTTTTRPRRTTTTT